MAVKMPSPVEILSRRMMCPDCSPPKLKFIFCMASITYLSPISVRIRLILCLPSAVIIPLLVWLVPTTVLAKSEPSFFIFFARIYKILSPSKTSPLASTAIRRSASPSNAKPTSAFLSLTKCTRCSMFKLPHLLLIKSPLFFAPVLKTVAPSFENTRGAI